MARTVYVRGVGKSYSFPDGTSDKQVVSYLSRLHPPAPPPAPPPEEPIGALESGFYSSLGKLEAAGGKAAEAVGLEGISDYLLEESRKSQEYADKYKPSVADVTQIGGIGDLASFTGETIAQSAPETAVGVGGAYAGAAAGAAVGSVFPLVGTTAGALAGGLIGGAIASLPFFVGGNLQRQAEEQGIPLEETDLTAASVGAIAQAPLDAAFETLIARKLPGGGAALDVVRQGFLKEVAKSAGQGALTEALTEPAQQAIELAQANPEKLREFGPEVQKEILNAAAAGALAGGAISGVAGGVGAIGKPTEQSLAQKELRTDITAKRLEGDQLKRAAEVNMGVEKLAAQPQIGRLKLDQITIEPTKENGLRAPVKRFRVTDYKGNAIAEFSDPVLATNAVDQYKKLSKKNIILQGLPTGAEIPTAKISAAAAPEAKVTPPQVTQPAEVPPVATPKVEPTGEGMRPVKTFKTALGSEYTIYPDGGTQRLKTLHPGHPVTDVGLKRKSEKTYYIRPEDKFNLDIIQTEGPIGTMAIVEYAPGQIGVKIMDGKDAGKFIRGTIVKKFDDPEIGLSPLEVWDGGTGTHFGNKITEIAETPIVEPVAEPVTAEPTPSEPTVVTAEELSTETSPIGAVESVAAVDIPSTDLRSAIAAGKEAMTVSPEEQIEVRQKIEERTNKIAEEVRTSLGRYGLKDVQAKFVPAFVDGMKVRPQLGAAGMSGDKAFIKLAVGIFDPDMPIEQMVDRVIDTLNHETIHSLLDLGLIRPVEMKALLEAASRTKMKGKKYTYLDYVKTIYDPKKPGMELYKDPDAVAEESVAEMFREWRKGYAGVPTNSRGLINRIVETLRRIFGAMKRQSYESIFEDIAAGRVGKRQRDIKRAKDSRFLAGEFALEERKNFIPENTYLSVAPSYPFGQRVPQSTAEATNRAIEELEYGAVVSGIAKLFKSKTLSFAIPKRFRPSEDAITDFMQKFADRILPLGQMIDYVKQNGGTVTDALDVYMQAQLSQSITSNSLQERTETLFEPLMKYIRESGLSQAEFEDYLYARHAPERNARIRKINPSSDPSIGSGMTDEEAAEIIYSVDNSTQRNSFFEAERLFRKIIEDTNNLRVESGLTPDFNAMMIEDENGDLVQVDNYEFYVPLRGFADESILENEIEPEMRARIGQGFKIRGREDMRAFGRRSKASDILAHAMLQNSEAVVRAAKNKVNVSLLNLIETNPELMADYGVEVMTRGKKPMKKYVTSKGVVKTMVDPTYKNRDDVLIAKRNGEEVPIRINNRFLQKALIVNRSADPSNGQKVFAVLQWVNRWLASVNTVYNPEFILINFSRDLQQALVNVSQYEIDGIKSKILKDSLPAALAVRQILSKPETENDWSQWYKMFREDGGNTSGFWGSFSVEETLRDIEKMSADPSGSVAQRGLKALQSGLKIVENMNEAFENSIRLAVYKNSIEAGVSRQKAAFIAKNLTVNFDQRGEYGPLLNSLYLFYNASVQGTMALAMAATRSKKVQKIIGGIFMAGLLQDLINSQMSGDEDDNPYDKIPDYKLENNIIIMDPYGIAKDGYFAIPLPYGSNAFYNFGRAFSRSLRGGYTTSEGGTSILFTFFDAFNPIGGTESYLNFAAPTVIDPLVALSLNMDFSGKRIYPEPFPGSVPKADSQMYFSSTNPVFTKVADFLNSATGGSEYVPGMIDLSPDAMEYIYDYILGSAGGFVKRVYDTSFNTLPAIVSGDLQNIEINNVPILRKLYGNVSERVSFEDYFDKVNHVLARGEELKSAIKEGDPDRIKTVRVKFADELKVYPAIKTLANQRNKLASELRKLRENEKIPPEVKRRRQELIQKQIEKITKRVDELYNKSIGNKYPGIFS
jgi:hypothetical protein